MNNEHSTPLPPSRPSMALGNSPSVITAPKQTDSVLDLTFLKFAVHAQQHRSDLLLATNNGCWVVLAAGGDKIERATRALTPVVENFKYNTLATREFNLGDTLAEAVEWMAVVGNECFHVIMELPVMAKVIGEEDLQETELEVMYALGIRGEVEVRKALKEAKLI